MFSTLARDDGVFIVLACHCVLSYSSTPLSTISPLCVVRGSPSTTKRPPRTSHTAAAVVAHPIIPR